MSNIYFVSDTHFSHRNILTYCARPFASIEEMNETLIQNWNDIVKPQDTIYHLGDFGIGDVVPILRRLNGNKILIIGNHDKPATKGEAKRFFNYQTHLKVINIDKTLITLCHYSMQVWPHSNYGSWHLFGHSHGQLKGIGESMDVGVDATKLYRPILFEEVRQTIEKVV